MTVTLIIININGYKQLKPLIGGGGLRKLQHNIHMSKLVKVLHFSLLSNEPFEKVISIG
jgi:hypothetical protein